MPSVATDAKAPSEPASTTFSDDAVPDCTSDAGGVAGKGEESDFPHAFKAATESKVMVSMGAPMGRSFGSFEYGGVET